MISETAFNFTAKLSVVSCWPKDLETLKVFSFAYMWRQRRQTLQVIRNNFHGRISQPQDRGASLVTVTNEPVPRSSITFLEFF